MTTTRETVLAAVKSVLDAVSGVTVLRNRALPKRMPDAGALVILRDGDPGEPEVILSPLTYAFRHEAEIEVIVTDADDDDRTQALDAALANVAAALHADRTLGGLCDWVEARAPRPSDLVAADGGVPLRAVIVPLQLDYDSTDPLGDGGAPLVPFARSLAGDEAGNTRALAGDEAGNTRIMAGV